MKNMIYLSLILLVPFVPVLAENAESGTAQSASIMAVTDGVIQPNGIFNVLTYETSQPFVLNDTKLREAGLAAGNIILKSDEIRIFINRDAMDAAPLARIWLNQREGGAYWFITGGEGSAADFTIPKGAAVVVWTRAGTKPVSWTNVFR